MFGFILNKTGLLGQSASLGLVAAAVLGAVIYTIQDRIKDLGKTYLPSRLGKRYAHRVSRLSVPPRGDGPPPGLMPARSPRRSPRSRRAARTR